MKLVELGTFAILVLFIGGMTLTNQERLDAEKQEVKDRKETIELEQRLAALEANTAKFTVTHDQKLETNWVHAMLDAGTSFDAGNAAQFIKVKVPSYNDDKPICIKWNKECADSRTTVYVPTPGLHNKANNGLFEDNKCECEEYATDDCGDRIYEQECAKYLKSCEGEENCMCDEWAWNIIDYVDACEYRKLDHEGRRDYVTSRLPNLLQDELTYSWEQQSGPALNQDLFNHYKNDKVLKLELTQGDYTFSCTVTDPYGFESYLEKDINVAAEPNNDPEVFIGYTRLGGSDLDEFLTTKKKIEAAASKKK